MLTLVETLTHVLECFNRRENEIRSEMEEPDIDNNGAGKKMGDRISALPDELIHHILSYLDMADVAQTNILSKRWKDLWFSTPCLDFDHRYWVEKESSTSFKDFVSNVMNRRSCSDNKVSKLGLKSWRHNLDTSPVSSWVTMCLQRNLQHLCLDFPFTSDYDFPIVLLPNVISPTSGIRKLQLCGVVLPHGNADQELVLSSRLLQDLDMDQCDIDHLKTLTVSTPLLEKLKLTLSTDREVASKVNVKIYTPKLQRLGLCSWSDERTAAVYYSVEENLVSLVSACISIIKFGSALSFDNTDGCSQSLIDILSKVYTVRILKLLICTKQILADFPVLLEGLPYQFQNLRSITLMDKIQTPCIHAISKFLASFPPVETFVWHRFLDRVAHEAEESIANNLEESLSNLSLESVCRCLKTVEFCNLEGTEIELMFLGSLLERAFLLEKVVIKYNQLLSGGKLEDFKGKVLSSPRASSNASISFLVAID